MNVRVKAQSIHIALEWDEAKDLAEFLDQFYDATEAVSDKLSEVLDDALARLRDGKFD